MLLFAIYGRRYCCKVHRKVRDVTMKGGVEVPAAWHTAPGTRLNA